MSTDLSDAKQRLLDKLGPNYGVYIQLLGKWFRGTISKEEFDMDAKNVIEQNFVLEHNKFWLAFFHHCTNSESKSTHNLHIKNAIGKQYNIKADDHQDYGDNYSPDSTSGHIQPNNPLSNGIGVNRVRCLPNKVLTHMKIFVIAWEMGLDSANDHVSLYINLALQHFLKNIITELVCTKTAYRLRENRFKYAIGVKPINPYLNNSLKIYSSNLEYDPYLMESNKTNSSLVDTCAYTDSLFPSRLYEAQALYEYACSTSSVSLSRYNTRPKRLKISDMFWTQDDKRKTREQDSNTNNNLDNANDRQVNLDGDPVNKLTNNIDHEETVLCSKISDTNNSKSNELEKKEVVDDERRLTLFHLLTAFLSNKTIIPSQSLYSINLERIFTKLSYY